MPEAINKLRKRKDGCIEIRANRWSDLDGAYHTTDFVYATTLYNGLIERSKSLSDSEKEFLKNTYISADIENSVARIALSSCEEKRSFRVKPNNLNYFEAEVISKKPGPEVLPPENSIGAKTVDGDDEIYKIVFPSVPELKKGLVNNSNKGKFNTNITDVEEKGRIARLLQENIEEYKRKSLKKDGGEDIDEKHARKMYFKFYELWREIFGLHYESFLNNKISSYRAYSSGSRIDKGDFVVLDILDEALKNDEDQCESCGGVYEMENLYNVGLSSRERIYLLVCKSCLEFKPGRYEITNLPKDLQIKLKTVQSGLEDFDEEDI